MTRHFKHLLGRYKIGQAKNAVKQAQKQHSALLKTQGIELKDHWVEIQVFLYDTEKD